MVELDTPAFGDPKSPNWATLYRARGTDVNEARPLFTGDVLDLTDLGHGLVIVLQHPCALRTNGVDLVDRVLLARVVPESGSPPLKWHGSFKKMPLPDLIEGDNFEASFVDLEILGPADLRAGTRVASLSQEGINLLMQRWVFHNSRAVIPLANYQEVSSAEFEEADLTEDWCDDRILEGVSLEDATAEAHEWLRSNSPGGPTWQSLLADPGARSTVRIEMRRARRNL